MLSWIIISHQFGTLSLDFTFSQALDSKLVAEKRFPRHTLPAFSSNLKQTTPVVSAYTRELKRDIVTVGGRLPAEQCLLAPIMQNEDNIGFVVLLSINKKLVTDILIHFNHRRSQCL